MRSESRARASMAAIRDAVEEARDRSGSSGDPLWELLDEVRLMADYCLRSEYHRERIFRRALRSLAKMGARVDPDGFDAEPEAGDFEESVSNMQEDVYRLFMIAPVGSVEEAALRSVYAMVGSIESGNDPMSEVEHLMRAVTKGLDRETRSAEVQTPAPAHAYPKTVVRDVGRRATVVRWSDGTATVARCDDDVPFDPYVGALVCVAKRLWEESGRGGSLASFMGELLEGEVSERARRTAERRSDAARARWRHRLERAEGRADELARSTHERVRSELEALGKRPHEAEVEAVAESSFACNEAMNRWYVENPEEATCPSAFADEAEREARAWFDALPEAAARALAAREGGDRHAG